MTLLQFAAYGKGSFGKLMTAVSISCWPTNSKCLHFWRKQSLGGQIKIGKVYLADLQQSLAATAAVIEKIHELLLSLVAQKQKVVRSQ